MFLACARLHAHNICVFISWLMHYISVNKERNDFVGYDFVGLHGIKW